MRLTILSTYKQHSKPFTRRAQVFPLWRIYRGGASTSGGKPLPGGIEPGYIEHLAEFFRIITIPPIVSVGLISAVAFKDEMLAMSVSSTAGIPLSFLSGSFIPLPKVVLFGEVEIWHINPLYSASEAIRKILFYEYSLSQMFVEITLVLAVGSAIFLLGAYFFYKTVYRSE